MRTRVNRLITLGAAFAILSSLPASGDPADPQAPGESRWAPAFALTGGFTAQQQESSVESFTVTGGLVCDLAPDFNAQLNCGGAPPIGRWVWWPRGKLRPATSGVEHVVSPYLGASLELMAPAITRLPGRPRLFVTGEILPTFGTQRKIATEGNPTGAKAPISPDGDAYTNNQFPEVATEGVGSETRSEVQRGVWAAGIGIAFPFEFKGRQLRVKPSFGWLRYEVDVEGVLEHAIKDDYNIPSGTAGWGQSGPHLRAISATASDSRAFDSIGPGLELEMDVGRWGPLQPCIFFNANAYRVLGDLTFELSSNVSFDRLWQTQVFWMGESYTGPDILCTSTNPRNPPGCNVPRVVLPAGDYAGVWRHEVHPWMFRMGMGLRFRWVGK